MFEYRRKLSEYFVANPITSSKQRPTTTKIATISHPMTMNRHGKVKWLDLMNQKMSRQKQRPKNGYNTGIFFFVQTSDFFQSIQGRTWNWVYKIASFQLKTLSRVDFDFWVQTQKFEFSQVRV